MVGDIVGSLQNWCVTDFCIVYNIIYSSIYMQADLQFVVNFVCGVNHTSDMIYTLKSVCVHGGWFLNGDPFYIFWLLYKRRVCMV